MKVLSFTTLFPNHVSPTIGVFVENRLRHFVNSQSVDLQVVAPVPWFPFRHSKFGRYSEYSRVVSVEERHGIRIYHPKYPVLPKIGMTISPFALAWFSRKVLDEIISKGYQFDIIDAHYYFPDGVAAAILASHFGRPLCITARGTDINLIPNHRLARRMIAWAAARANRSITVCEALKQRLVELGVAESRVTVLRNGVDLELFSPPLDRAALRKSLEAEHPLALSVGHLIKRKGHDRVIKAVAAMRGVDLWIVGDGPERRSLEKLTADLNMQERVRFLGKVPHEGLPSLYGAADVLVLASDREGWPNVLLESMACGTPVVATAVWGTPEVVASEHAGTLVDTQAPEDIRQGIQTVLNRRLDRHLTRRYAEGFDWAETSEGLYRVMADALAEGPLA